MDSIQSRKTRPAINRTTTTGMSAYPRHPLRPRCYTQKQRPLYISQPAPVPYKYRFRLPKVYALSSTTHRSALTTLLPKYSYSGDPLTPSPPPPSRSRRQSGTPAPRAWPPRPARSRGRTGFHEL
ncbi:hypothetical protein NEOLEDRAFT_665266 [Neolentinus lepideus HHB14362 ss-1]|uniref:Uncharacterized protein n=1 Tax=Neolentinus lepideus HHB14362 ss-1 TaxID=1314782 RepID=A0A165QDG6_9AGAM|nr:hypothetical protein NEOLEDRAFT_665266 [Neolentinus lepideus HHB14362 ss-1]